MGQLKVDADTQAGICNDEFGAYRGSIAIMSPFSDLDGQILSIMERRANSGDSVD